MAVHAAYKVNDFGHGTFINATDFTLYMSGEIEVTKPTNDLSGNVNPGCVRTIRSSTGKEIGLIDETPSVTSKFKDVTKATVFPDKEEGVFYFVTEDVAMANPTRDDFYFCKWSDLNGGFYSFFKKE